MDRDSTRSSLLTAGLALGILAVIPPLVNLYAQYTWWWGEKIDRYLHSSEPTLMRPSWHDLPKRSKHVRSTAILPTTHSPTS